MQSSLVNSEIMRAVLDPVTFEIYKNPIMCPHGHTFESGTLLSKTNEEGIKLLQCATTGVYFPETEYRKNYLVTDLTKLIFHILERKEEIDATRGDIKEIRDELRQTRIEREILKQKHEKLELDSQKQITELKARIDLKSSDIEYKLLFQNRTAMKVIMFISTAGYIAYKILTQKRDED